MPSFSGRHALCYATNVHMHACTHLLHMHVHMNMHLQNADHQYSILSAPDQFMLGLTPFAPPSAADTNLLGTLRTTWLAQCTLPYMDVTLLKSITCRVTTQNNNNSSSSRVGGNKGGKSLCT